jgi:predicted dehydrogenase
MKGHRFRIGVVGAGHVSTAHLNAFQEVKQYAAVVGICDVDVSLARTKGQNYGIEAVFQDVDSLLSQTDCDAVDICTIHDQHYPVALKAIAAGKHVLVEKPFACTLQQCVELVAAAEEAGVTLMVAHQQRYSPSYRGIRRLIQTGTLGSIQGARIDAMQDMRRYAGPGHWLYDGARAGGGILISVLIHKLDLLRFFLGDVARISGKRKTTNPNFVNGAEDYVYGLLEFANGVDVELFGVYSAVRMPYGEGLMLFGAAGTVHCIEFGNYLGPALYATDDVPAAGTGWAELQYSGFIPVPPDRESLVSENSTVNQMDHFIRCCRDGIPCVSSGRDNLGTMATVFGVYESSDRGEPVTVHEMLEAINGTRKH